MDGSPYGIGHQVLKLEVTENVPKCRIQLDRTGPAIPAPFEISFSIYIPEEFPLSALGGWTPFTVFDLVPGDPLPGGGAAPDYNIVAVVNLWDLSGITALGIKKLFSGEDFRRAPGTTRLRMGSVNEFRVFANDRGEIEYYLNGIHQVTLPTYGTATTGQPVKATLRTFHSMSLYGKTVPKGAWILAIGSIVQAWH